MTQISRAALQTLINSTIYTNLTNDITGDDVNDVCTDINDSSVNWVTDVENTLTNTSTKIPTSAAVWANKPIISVNNSTWNSLVTSNQLRVGYAYLVDTGYNDPIWSYSWTALVIAASGNTIHPISWAISQGFVNEFVKINTVADFNSWQFLETCGQNMTLSAAQASAYNIAANSTIAGNTRVFVSITDYLGNTREVETTTNLAGDGIITQGSSQGVFYAMNFASDLAVPMTPITVKKSLTSANLLAGGDFQLLPRVNNYFWTVNNAQFFYTFDSSAYTGLGLKVRVDSATREIMISKTTFNLSTTDSTGQFEFVTDIADETQYVTNDELMLEVVAGTGGDGTMDVYVTAMLVEA